MNSRLDFFHGSLTKNLRVLEIGPSYRPICPKKDGWNVTIADHASKDDLIHKYHQWNINTDLIEDVDIILGPNGLSEIFPKHSFSSIIASHVIEHVPNPIGFFRSAAELLCDGGTMQLAVPDKRFCFDVVKSLTTPGQLIDAYTQNRKSHSLAQLIDGLMLHIKDCGQIVFPNVETSKLMAFGHTPQEAYLLAQKIYQTGTLYDIHGWVYTPHSFRAVWGLIGKVGLLPFTISQVKPDNAHEFLVELVKSDSGTGSLDHHDELIHDLVRAIREQAHVDPHSPEP